MLEIHIFVTIMYTQYTQLFFPLNLSNKILAIIYNTLFIIVSRIIDYNILYRIYVND